MNAYKKSKRGFFFTIMALAILSFMLLTVQLWVRTYERGDERAAARFKGEAMRIVLFTLSDKTMSDFANASAFFAIYHLANYSSQEGYGLAWQTADDTRNPGTGLVEFTVQELMFKGESSPSSSLPITYTDDEKARYTLASWQSKIRSAANVMGFNTTFSDMENYAIHQSDPWSINVYFEMQMNISDLAGTMYQSKRLKANSTFSVNGFLDPSVSRNDKSQRCNSGDCQVAQKQVFKHLEYNTPAELKPVKLVSEEYESGGVVGNGWFYGPMTFDYPDAMNESELGRLSQYVLVHSFDDNLTLYANYYGAVVITDLPEWVDGGFETRNGCYYNVTVQKDCLNCWKRLTSSQSGCGSIEEQMLGENDNTTDRPVIAIDGSGKLDPVPVVNRAGLISQKFILIDNRYEQRTQNRQGYHRIWDITALRDMTICGFYVKSEKAPSFFQRMLANSQSLANSELGIETFLVGRWAGGADDQIHDSKSRLDWEFYSPTSSIPTRIKGMPGCKSLEMCSVSNTNATTVGLGKFKLSSDAISRYGLEDIACNDATGSPCDG